MKMYLNIPNGLGTEMNEVKSKGRCNTLHITVWSLLIVFNDNPKTQNESCLKEIRLQNNIIQNVYKLTN